MNLLQLYNRIIRLGAQEDPRLNKAKIKSYPDTAILYGNPNKQIKKILVGIDIEAGELLLADKIRQREGLDLVIAHHPEGRAYAALHEVMRLQVDMLIKAGIPQRVGRQLLEARMGEVERKVLPHNHMRAVDIARLLDLPFMCVHTPADNHAYSFMQKLMDKEKPKRTQDILDILREIPEYKDAIKENAGPRLILGNPKRAAGKVFLEMTGGTEGPKEVFDKLYKTGIRTLVSMHLSEEHFKKVKETHLNVIIAGHISSDNLGLNLLLDRVEKTKKLQITNCSGFRRICRD